jgi:hypothetical protein
MPISLKNVGRVKDMGKAAKYCCLMVGPLLAGCLYLSLRIFGFGSGIALLVYLAIPLFLLVAPAIQIFLTHSKLWNDRDVAVCVFTISSIIGLICVCALIGFFDFW